MSHIEKNDPNLEEQDQKEQEPEPVIDEEFEKKQKRENEIIETVLDGIFTFFR
ncbi:MAG: hypothetical protein IKG67_10880 [Parasporobacterium sp.]|nr:hypothetical protein [Parasporobacterium sp.]